MPLGTRLPKALPPWSQSNRLAVCRTHATRRQAAFVPFIAGVLAVSEALRLSSPRRLLCALTTSVVPTGHRAGIRVAAVGSLGTPNVPSTPSLPPPLTEQGVSAPPGRPPMTPPQSQSLPTPPGGYSFSSADANAPPWKDPGRPQLVGEFLKGPQKELVELPLEHQSGSVLVASHMASESNAPPGTPHGTTQEWRTMKFRPADDQFKMLQSVTKVCLGPPGHEPKEWLWSEAMPVPYMRSLVSVTLSGLAVLGAVPVFQNVTEASDSVRILCIGLGGGSIPSFLAERLPHCEVDVVELEQSVVDAASQHMGFIPGPNLRVIVEDAACFALRAAEENARIDGDGFYDAVILDAYDPAGDVPSVFWTQGSPFLQALHKGLLKRCSGILAANFAAIVDLPPKLKAYRDALSEQGVGLGFSVEAEGIGQQNRILVQTCGGPCDIKDLQDMGERMVAAAQLIRRVTNCPFQMSQLAARNIRQEIIQQPS